MQPPWINSLPSVNACLNAGSALLLLAGYRFVRRKEIATHKLCMGSAFCVSALFLVSYLTYHAFHGATRFPGTGWARLAYLTLLASHTLLAVVIVPLVLRTLYLAARRRFDAHQVIARWTWPLWLYVSVTGVIIYWMLYRVSWVS